MTMDQQKIRDKLLPCPKCGCNAEIVIHHYNNDAVRVKCMMCNMGTSTYNNGNLQFAVSAWNGKVTSHPNNTPHDCPECGGTARLIQDYTGSWKVQCDVCSVHTCAYATRHDALNVWNSLYLTGVPRTMEDSSE